MSRSRTLIQATSLLIALIASAGCSAASPALKFTGADGRTATVPFRMRNNHIYVRGQVNASDSLWFFVDTGAGSNVVSSGVVPRLGLKAEDHGQALGVGGTVAAQRVVGATIKLAGLEFGDVLTVAIPLEPIATQIGVPVEGIVGAPLFENAVVEVDYDHSQLIVHAPGTFHYAGPGKAVPIEVRGDKHPYLEGTLTLEGGKPIAGAFTLDTGSSSALILGPEFVAQHHAMESLAKSITGRSGGVGGASLQAVGRVARLAVGPYVLEEPIAMFSQNLGGQVTQSDAMGNIGGEILRRFKPIFDYRSKTVILEPSALYGAPFETDMSGIVPKILDDGSHRVVVAAIQPDSPASEAGLAEGDVLESVDGAPLDATSLSDLRVRLKRVGETVHFGVVRGDARSEITLVTRRLI